MTGSGEEANEAAASSRVACLAGRCKGVAFFRPARLQLQAGARVSEGQRLGWGSMVVGGVSRRPLSTAELNVD